jgi:hypothetical protein
MAISVLHSVGVGVGSQSLYFKTTDCYESIGAKCGITKVTAVSGDEEVIPVKELLRTGRLMRAQIQYLGGGKKKTSSVLVARSKVADILGDDATKHLKGSEYKIGNSVKGTIQRTYFKRDASFY